MTFVEPDPSLEGIAALERIEVEFAAVERALDRLDAGTYGRCEVCGAPISDDVLAADPVAPACADHDRSPQTSPPSTPGGA